MTPATRFRVCLLIAAAAAAAIIAPRYIADPYGVFRAVDAPTHKQVNLRIVKQDRLQAGCAGADSYVLGNSRATAYETAALEDIYGGRFFNMNVPAETWRGIELRALWLIDHCSPERLIVSLSPAAFRYGFFDESYSRVEPAMITGRPDWLIRADFLRVPMSAAFTNADSQGQFLYEPATGHWRYPALEARRASGEGFPGASRCASPGERSYRPKRYAGQKRALARILKAAGSQDVELVFIVEPLSATILTRLGAEIYTGWLTDVAPQVPELVFLGGFHDFTLDGVNYWDQTHFRPGPTTALLNEALKHRNGAMVGAWSRPHYDRLTAMVAANYAGHAYLCDGTGGS